MIESYDTLPLGKYIRITEILNEPGADNLEKQAQVLEVLTGMPAQQLVNLPIIEYAGIVAKSRFLDDDIKKPDVRKQYQCGTWRLVPTSDIRRITTAQYVDFQTFSKKQGHNFVEILSCLLVPEGKRYNEGYDIVEVQQSIRDYMPVSDALAVYAFFFGSLQSSMEALLIYLRARIRMMRIGREQKEISLKELKIMQERMRALRRGGAGSDGWTRSRRHAAATGKASGR